MCHKSKVPFAPSVVKTSPVRLRESCGRFGPPFVDRAEEVRARPGLWARGGGRRGCRDILRKSPEEISLRRPLEIAIARLDQPVSGKIRTIAVERPDGSTMTA